MKEEDPPALNSLMESLKDHYGQIEKALEVEMDRYKESYFYGSLRYALEAGKRIRPIILLLSAENIGRTSIDPLPVAVAVELLHTESIIHDDILDNEIIRRNRPAYHIRYGLGASLLTADFVFGIILNIASRYKDEKIAEELSLVALCMCEGELRELGIEPKTHQLSWDEYIDLIFQKTASLFEVSAKIGAMVGGGTENQIRILSRYGRLLGIAYQIQDDLQDWGKKGNVANALKMERDDIPSYLRKMSEHYALEAKQELEPLRDTNAKRHLIDLADFMILRRF